VLMNPVQHEQVTDRVDRQPSLVGVMGERVVEVATQVAPAAGPVDTELVDDPVEFRTAVEKQQMTAEPLKQVGWVDPVFRRPESVPGVLLVGEDPESALSQLAVPTILNRKAGVVALNEVAGLANPMRTLPHAARSDDLPDHGGEDKKQKALLASSWSSSEALQTVPAVIHEASTSLKEPILHHGMRPNGQACVQMASLPFSSTPVPTGQGVGPG
jgi:hypothetical protein